MQKKLKDVCNSPHFSSNKLRIRFDQTNYCFDRRDISLPFFNNEQTNVDVINTMISEIEKNCDHFNELKGLRKMLLLFFLLPLISLIFTLTLVILGIEHRHFKYVMYAGIVVSFFMVLIILFGLFWCIRGKKKIIFKKYCELISSVLNEYNSIHFKKNGMRARYATENTVTAYSRRRTLGTSKAFVIIFEKNLVGDFLKENQYCPPNTLTFN